MTRKRKSAACNIHAQLHRSGIDSSTGATGGVKSTNSPPSPPLSIANVSTPGNKDKSRKGAAAKLLLSTARYHQIVVGYAKTWTMSRESIRYMRALLGRGYHTSLMLASDEKVRCEFGNLLIESMCDQWQLAQTHASRKFFFITIIDKAGTTLDRQPEFDNRNFIDRVRKYVIRHLPVSAIGVMELQAATNFPQGGRGRHLLFHCHLIAWSDDPTFDPGEAMRRCKSFSSEISIRAIHIEPIKETEGDMAYLGYYMSKPPLYGKRRVPSAKSPTGYKFKASLKGMRPELCLRVLEILSHFCIDDLVFGIGEGVAVRAAIFKDLRKWHRTERRGSKLFELTMKCHDYWASLRTSNGSKNYLPPRLII